MFALTHLCVATAAPATEHVFVEYGPSTGFELLVEEGRASLFVGFGGPRHLEAIELPLSQHALETVDGVGPYFGEFMLATRDMAPALYGTLDDEFVELGELGVEVLLGPRHGRIRSAYDVNGDGREDVCPGLGGSSFTPELVLTSPDGVYAASLPNRHPVWNQEYCTSDVHGDGHADLLQLHYDEWLYVVYFTFVARTTVHLHPGGPDGYASQSEWSLAFTGAVHRGVPLQADGDAALELMLTVGSLERLWYDHTTESLAVVDGLDTASPTVSQTVENPALLALGAPERTIPAELHNAGDLDGDGMDEMAVCVLPLHDDADTVDGELRFLTAIHGYDFDQPLFRLPLEPRPDELRTTVYRHCTFDLQDVDRDGHLDAYVMAGGDQGSEDNPVLLQVWYGPLFEPPDPKPHTGDTGTLQSTADTGASTADTQHETTTTGDTAAPTTAPRTKPSDEPGGCGCSSTPSPSVALLLLLPPALWRRRCSS